MVVDIIINNYYNDSNNFIGNLNGSIQNKNIKKLNKD